jgi:hypothetical protein
VKAASRTLLPKGLGASGSDVAISPASATGNSASPVSFRSPWSLLAKPVDSRLREEDEPALPTLSVSGHD